MSSSNQIDLPIYSIRKESAPVIHIVSIVSIIHERHSHLIQFENIQSIQFGLRCNDDLTVPDQYTKNERFFCPEFGGYLCHRGIGDRFSGKLNTTSSLFRKNF
ncbi:MAG: hypothetical protein OXF84_05600, partial [Bacteroidetes bacterium]|nr:hypothetical protein [Bacteroidota bacterium]